MRPVCAEFANYCDCVAYFVTTADNVLLLRYLKQSKTGCYCKDWVHIDGYERRESACLLVDVSS